MTTQSSALVALSNDFSATIERAAASVVAVEGRGRVGSSGYYVRPHLIVTADHAVEDDDDIEIVVAGGASEAATVVGRDPSTDLALLRTERPGDVLEAASADLRVGALAFGVARDDDGDLATAMGVVGTLAAPWHTWQGGAIDRFIRPALDLSARFSGGPLVDASGAAIGMNTAGLSRRRVLTVPAATIARVVDVLATRGFIPRGYLGVALQALHVPAAFGGGHGAVIVGVEGDSPAEHGGLIVGDLIVGIGGTRHDVDDVHAAIAAAGVGATIALDLIRGGAPLRADVRIGERPA